MELPPQQCQVSDGACFNRTQLIDNIFALDTMAIMVLGLTTVAL